MIEEKWTDNKHPSSLEPGINQIYIHDFNYKKWHPDMSNRSTPGHDWYKDKTANFLRSPWLVFNGCWFPKAKWEWNIHEQPAFLAAIICKLFRILMALWWQASILMCNLVAGPLPISFAIICLKFVVLFEILQHIYRYMNIW